MSIKIDWSDIYDLDLKYWPITPEMLELLDQKEQKEQKDLIVKMMERTKSDKKFKYHRELINKRSKLINDYISRIKIFKCENENLE